MKTFLQTVALSLIMVFSVQTANAAKANHDRTKVPVTKAAAETKKAKQKAKKSGGEHEVSWGENARSAKNKTKAIDHNASRSNTTASKIQPKPGSKNGTPNEYNSSKSNKTTSKVEKPDSNPSKANDWNSTRSQKNPDLKKQ